MAFGELFIEYWKQRFDGYGQSQAYFAFMALPEEQRTMENAQLYEEGGNILSCEFAGLFVGVTINGVRAFKNTITGEIVSVDTVLGSGAGGAAGKAVEGASNSEIKVGEYLAKKAPNQVTPGTRILEGQYVDDLGRVQPWKAYYDEYGRLVGRTDYNAGNKAAGIPDTHYHTYEWGPGKTPYESGSHIGGEYKP